MSLARCAVIVLLTATFSFAQTSKHGANSGKASAADLQATVEKLENDAWQAFKNKDEKAFADLCAPEYTAVNADQQPPHDLPGTIAEMKNDVTINSFSLSDFHVTPLGPDATLVTYTADTNLTFTNGKAQDVKLAVTDVWIKRRGHWKAFRYHESQFQIH